MTRFSVVALFSSVFIYPCSSWAQSVSLTLGAGSAAPGSSVTVPVNLSATASPAAVGWTFTYSASDVLSVAVSTGPAAAAVAKTVTCASSPGRTVCVVAGLNDNAIGNGVVASANVQISATPSSSTIPVGITGAVAASPTAVAISAAATGATITATGLATAQLSSLSCAPAALVAGTTSDCTVSLTAAAPAGGAAVALSDTSTSVSIPSTLTIPAGALTGKFSALTSTGATTTTVTISASLGSTKKSAVLSISAMPQMAGLTCNRSSVTAGDVVSCTATLSSAAPAGGISVSVSSSLPIVKLPSTVQVSAAATAAQFDVTASPVSSQQTTVITAAVGSSSRTASLTITTAPLFALHGNTTELIGTVNGSVVNASSPAGLTGRLTVRGSGYLAFVPVTNGNGVKFEAGGTQNSSTAFITFSGAGIGNIFKTSGEISFSVKSAYSFAERNALPSLNNRVALDVFDNSTRLYYFNVFTYAGRMIFSYSTGSSIVMYYVPIGQEDAVFGKNVVLRVRLVWTGTSATLFLNGTAVQTAAYTRITPNWTSLSSFTIGAQDVHASSGGWSSFDDVIADVEVR